VVLLNFANNDYTRNEFVERKGVEALISLTLSEEPQLQIVALKAIARVAEHEQYQWRVAQAGALMPLLLQLNSSSEEVQEYAAKALANLAENFENQSKIVGAGGIQSFFSLLPSKYPGVLDNVTKALANVSQNPSSHDYIVDGDMVSILIIMGINSVSHIAQANTIQTLANICHLPSALARMRDSKIFIDALKPIAADTDRGKIHDHAFLIQGKILECGGPTNKILRHTSPHLGGTAQVTLYRTASSNGMVKSERTSTTWRRKRDNKEK